MSCVYEMDSGWHFCEDVMRRGVERFGTKDMRREIARGEGRKALHAQSGRENRKRCGGDRASPTDVLRH